MRLIITIEYHSTDDKCTIKIELISWKIQHKFNLMLKTNILCILKVWKSRNLEIVNFKEIKKYVFITYLR